MSDSSITMALDMKKGRIRIHKSTLHILGDPQYIQILVNDETMQLALKCIEKPHSGDQCHKTNVKNLGADESCEFYSFALVSKLCELIKDIDAKHTYRLTNGKHIKTHDIALFELSSIEKVES